VLGFDPTDAAAERVGVLAILAISDERPIADHDMLERSHWRELSRDWLTFGEEGHIEAGFHRQEA
jgi:hypothetical protein